MTIDKDEFTVWREHPVTQAFLKRLHDREREFEDWWWAISWNVADKSDLNGDELIKQLANLHGSATAYRWAREVEYEDLFPKEDE